MQESVKFCAQCGSSSVDFSSLLGGNASCNGCGWIGVTEELLAVPITHEFVGKEEMLIRLMNELRKILPIMGPDMLKLLLNWGFLEGSIEDARSIDVAQFSRYLAAGCGAWLSSILSTRELLERARIARNLEAS